MNAAANAVEHILSLSPEDRIRIKREDDPLLEDKSFQGESNGVPDMGDGSSGVLNGVPDTGVNATAEAETADAMEINHSSAVDKTKVCSNCKGKLDRNGKEYDPVGHTARECSRCLDQDGFLNVCPFCNVSDHNANTCPEDAPEAKAAFYFMIQKRHGKPPYRCDFKLAEIDPKKWEGIRGVRCRPQTPAFAKARSLELGDQGLSEMILDPFWEDEANLWNNEGFFGASKGSLALERASAPFWNAGPIKAEPVEVEPGKGKAGKGKAGKVQAGKAQPAADQGIKSEKLDEGKTSTVRRGPRCHQCHEFGHVSRDCPGKEPNQDAAAAGTMQSRPATSSSSGPCFICKQDGHIARDCQYHRSRRSRRSSRSPARDSRTSPGGYRDRSDSRGIANNGGRNDSRGIANNRGRNDSGNNRGRNDSRGPQSTATYQGYDIGFGGYGASNLRPYSSRQGDPSSLIGLDLPSLKRERDMLRDELNNINQRLNRTRNDVEYTRMIERRRLTDLSLLDVRDAISEMENLEWRGGRGGGGGGGRGGGRGG